MTQPNPINPSPEMIEAGGLEFRSRHANCCYPQALDFECNFAAEAIYLAMQAQQPNPSLADELTTLQARLDANDALWSKFAENISLEVSWGELDNDASECGWRVHARFGNRNDREWKLVSTGGTPLEALNEALAKDGEV